MNTTIQRLSILPANAITHHHGQLVTNSLKVAEAFGKRHDDVLRKVRAIECSDEYRLRNFAETVTERANPSGGGPIRRPIVEMTRDGFIFLVMGFTGKKAAHIKEAYINAFNQMEQALLNPESVLSEQNLTCLASNATAAEQLWREHLKPALMALDSPYLHELNERMAVAGYLGRCVLKRRG